MRLFCYTAFLCAGMLLLSLDTAHAGMPSKGLKIDPMLQKAIEDSADDVVEEEEEEVFVEPVVVEEPPEEPAPLIQLPKMPKFPVYVEEKPPEDRKLFSWPEEPGVEFGGMMFYPSILAKTGWTDNLYASQDMPESEMALHIEPRLRIEIPDFEHDFVLEGSMETRRHLKNEDEDYHDSRLSMEAALNASHGFSVPFGFVYSKSHEEREDDLTRQLPVKPLDIDHFGAHGGITIKPGSFGIGLIGHYEKDRFEDGNSLRTGQQVIRRDADRDITDLEFNTSFDLDDSHTLMLIGNYGERDYMMASYQNGGFTGPKRTSKTFGGKLSWIFDTERFDGHMSLGISDMNYEDVAISDIREIIGDMEVNHYIGDRTTLNLQFERSVFEDAEVIDPIIRSRAGFYVDYQPWDEILLAAGADYNFFEFNNSGRDDERWDFRAIADYFYNDFLAFGLEYEYSQRDSEMANLDFLRNTVWLRARGRL